MSDIGESSSAGAKRQRGPPRRQRGAPGDAPQPPVQVIRRRISYHTPLVVPRPEDVPQPIDKRVLRRHTFLQYERLSEEYVRMDRFVQMEGLYHRSIDWDLVGQLGQRERIEQMLTERWRSALACEWTQYDELTVEFHSTWRHVVHRSDRSESVTFSLGRQVYEMTLPRLAVALGFYTEDEVRAPEFERSLRGVTSRRGVPGITERQLAAFWEEIADTPFTTSVLESSIRDPVIRYIHRILACTLIGRRSGTEKCSQLDLFCLYCIVGGREANLASIFISSMARPRRGGPEARLDLGPYIGRLAERLGVFDRYPQGFLTPGPGTIPYDLEDLRKAGMCPWDGPPRWEPVRVVRPVLRGVVQRGVPPVGQRIAARAARAQERPQAPLSLEELRDQIFDRMDRTDAAIRFLMTHSGIEIPEFFREPDDLGGGDDELGEGAGTDAGDDGDGAEDDE